MFHGLNRECFLVLHVTMHSSLSCTQLAQKFGACTTVSQRKVILQTQNLAASIAMQLQGLVQPRCIAGSDQTVTELLAAVRLGFKTVVLYKPTNKSPKNSFKNEKPGSPPIEKCEQNEYKDQVPLF